MNKQRRQQLDRLSNKIADLNGQAVTDHAGLKSVLDQLIDYRTELDGIQDDEQEAFDNKPESLQESAQDALDEFITNVASADESLGELIDIAKGESDYDSEEVDMLFDEISDFLNDAQA